MRLLNPLMLDFEFPRTAKFILLATFLGTSVACGTPSDADAPEPPPPGEEQGEPDCGENGYWNADHSHCDCNDGFQRTIGTQCEPIEEEEEEPPVQESALPRTCMLPPVDCDPRTSEGCADGEVCDLGDGGNGTTTLVCYPPPNDVPLGGECNNQEGPFCEPGAWCTGPDSTCEKVCCDSSECSDDESCFPIFNDPLTGSLGTCRSGDAPQCLEFGAACTPGTNHNCCGECHVDHCH